MGWWPFRRDRSDDETAEKDVDRLVAEARGHSRPPPRSEDVFHGDGSFRLSVEDVFAISGRGTVVTGRVAAGSVSVGQQVQVVRGSQVVATTEVTAVEKFRDRLETATVGQQVGLFLAGLSRDQLQAGDLVTG